MNDSSKTDCFKVDEGNEFLTGGCPKRMSSKLGIQSTLWRSPDDFGLTNHHWVRLRVAIEADHYYYYYY